MNILSKQLFKIARIVRNSSYEYHDIEEDQFGKDWEKWNNLEEKIKDLKSSNMYYAIGRSGHSKDDEIIAYDTDKKKVIQQVEKEERYHYNNIVIYDPNGNQVKKIN